MPFATFADISTEPPIRFTVVSNPKLTPLKFRLRSLSSEDLTRLRVQMWEAKNDTWADTKLENDRQIFALCVVDELGNPIVPPNQEELIPLTAVNMWVIEEARLWAGLSVSLDSIVREEEKN